MLMLFRRTLVPLALYAFAAVASATVGLRLDPPCPTPSSPTLLFAESQGAGPNYVEAISTTLVDYRTLKVVYRAVPGAEGGSYVVAQSPLPALPPGDYHLQTYYRLDTGFLEPEVAGTFSNFRVEPTGPPNCPAWTLEVAGGGTQETLVSTGFSSKLSVVVKDQRGAGVPGAHVHFRRVSNAGDVGLPPSGADAVLSEAAVITDATGRADVAAAANGTSGSYGYAAFVIHANVTSSDYFDLRNRAAASPAGAIPVVEYFHAGYGHYFMTSDSAEMASLDSGVTKGWKRTGGVFSAIANNAPSASPVCRLYGKPEAGLDSHFYSASPAECADTLARFAGAWVLETNRAFSAWLPDLTTGACAAGVPLYRVFNNKADANHRYVLSKEGAQAMAQLGWTREGYGPDGVAMCVEP